MHHHVFLLPLPLPMSHILDVSASFSPFVSSSARPTPILYIPPFTHSILVHIFTFEAPTTFWFALKVTHICFIPSMRLARCNFRAL
ncbi:hypothetical protein BDW66DRAFT_123728 [Aspergillus desertorum]